MTGYKHRLQVCLGEQLIAHHGRTAIRSGFTTQYPAALTMGRHFDFDRVLRPYKRLIPLQYGRKIDK